MLITELKINTTYIDQGLVFVQREDGTILKFAGSREEAKLLARAIYQEDLRRETQSR